MAVSGYICDTSSYKRCTENMTVHEEHYKKANNIAQDLHGILQYEVSRAKASWGDYITSEADASGILFPPNVS